MDNYIATISAETLKTEIDQQVATAKAYPRDVKQAKDDLIATVTLDLDVAESCLYSIPRDGRCIIGKSVRLAEMAMGCWGNLRSAWRILAQSDQFVDCQGITHDLQKNVCYSADARRSIVDGKGRKYSPSMIQTTTMACGSIAYRNSIFKVVPAALIECAVNAAHKFIMDNVGDYKDKLKELMNAMHEVKVKPQQLCRYFRIERIEELSAAQFVLCRGIYRAIKSGETVAGDYFGHSGSTNGVSMDDLKTPDKKGEAK